MIFRAFRGPLEPESATASGEARARANVLAITIAEVEKTKKAVDKAKEDALKAAAEASVAAAALETQTNALNAVSFISADGNIITAAQVARASVSASQATVNAFNAMQLYTEACDRAADAKSLFEEALARVKNTASTAATPWGPLGAL